MHSSPHFARNFANRSNSSQIDDLSLCFGARSRIFLLGAAPEHLEG